MQHQCQSHDIQRASKKLCIETFSLNLVVNCGVQYACITFIIKIFFTIQKDFS